MAREWEGRTAEERRLFEFLAASRPERVTWGAGGSAAAIAASVGLHGAVMLLALWGTVLAAASKLDRVPLRAEAVQVVDLPPPAPSSTESGAVRAAAAPAEASPTHAAPATDEVAAEARRLLALAPPTIELPDIPPPSADMMAAFTRSEYGGIDEEASYTAAQILAVHHEATADQLAEAAPQFVSYTEAPTLVNIAQVKKELSRQYPSYLQANGVGGRVMLWFLIDEQGRVRRWLLKQSSGYKGLDRAALKVAGLMHFRPAVNYDHTVAVWVVLPVLFTLVEG